MRKNLLLAFAAVISANAFAQSEPQPQFLWAGMLNGTAATAGQMPMGAVRAADGDIYMLNQFSTKAASADTPKEDMKAWWYTSPTEKTDIATGSVSYSVINGTSNALLMKMNDDGSYDWVVYSSEGDISNPQALAATADGGVVMTFKYRHTNKPATGTALEIVDAKGKATTFTKDYSEWSTTSRFFRNAIVKVSKDGVVEWVKHIDFKDRMKDADNHITDGLDIDALTSDEAGNIYAAFSTAETVLVRNANDDQTTELTIEPRWTEGFDEKNDWTQYPAGGSYILKLDATGKTLAQFASTSTATKAYEKYFGMEAKNGKLYAFAKLKGEAGKNLTVSYGDKAVTNSTLGTDEIVTFGLNTSDMKTVDWARMFYCKPISSKKGTNFRTLQLFDNSLYIVLGTTGSWADTPDGEALYTAVNTGREGAVLKISAADGKTQNAYHSSKTMSYFSVFPQGDNLLADNYDGALDLFDAEGNLTNSWTLAKGKTIGTTATTVLDQHNVLSLVRSRKGFEVNGMTFTTVTNWGLLAALYDISSFFPTSGVESVDATQFSAIGKIGAVEVTTSAPATVRVFAISGQVVASRNVAEGTTTISLPAGFYIVNGKKVAVR